MKLGIFHPDKSTKFFKELRAMGFNAYVLEPDWDEVVAKYPKEPNIVLQRETAKNMWIEYDDLKDLGFVFFLNMGSGWGLGAYDNNHFFKIFYEWFESDNDVLFDVGEFYEDYVETGKISVELYNAILAEKKKVFGNRLELGNTARNKIRLGSNTLTSYVNQEKYWRGTDPFVWIFGQPAWHNFIPFIGSLWFKSKAKFCHENKIDVAFLYQHNPSAWNALGWENKIADILHIRQWFEKKQRERFIKYFNAVGD